MDEAAASYIGGVGAVDRGELSNDASGLHENTLALLAAWSPPKGRLLLPIGG